MKLINLLVAGAVALAMASCNNGGQQQPASAPVAPQPASGQVTTTPDSAAQQAAAQQAAAQAQGQPQALPEPITKFLQQYFPGTTVVRGEADPEFGGLDHDVTLNDGTEVDFDPANEWEKVDCHVKAVPAALVPAAIASFVKSNYQAQPIVKIDRKPMGYEIELANGLELKFDKNGSFMHVDD